MECNKNNLTQPVNEVDDKQLELIHQVKKHPCLYDKENEEYRRKETTKSVWKMIAKRLDWKKYECKTHWKSLKRKYLNGEISSEKITKKLKFLDDLRQSSNDDERHSENTVVAENTITHLKEIPNKDCNCSFPSQESTRVLHQNNDAGSISDESSDGIEEIKPYIDTIEIDSSSCTALSDTDEKEVDFSIETALNELWQNDESAITIEEFSKFLNEVVKTCRDFTPTLLSEMKDDIGKIVVNAKMKMSNELKT